MVCACSAGTWTTGKVNVQTVKTERIDNFLGMKDKRSYWPKPLVTDIGVERNANFSALAATGIAVAVALASKRISDKQIKIARGYLGLSQEQWRRHQSIYAPCERKEMAEACNAKVYSARYGVTPGEWVDNARLAQRSFARRWQQLSSPYGICPDTALNRVTLLANSATDTDTRNFGYRYEEHMALSLADTRWNRRAQALNRGRNLLAESLSAARLASDNLGGVQSSINSLGNSASQAAGYFFNRRQTQYPQFAAPQQGQETAPQAALLGSGFYGAEQSAGQFGMDVAGTPEIGKTPFAVDDATNLTGYRQYEVPYSSNNVVTSFIGSQQPTSSGS